MNSLSYFRPQKSVMTLFGGMLLLAAAGGVQADLSDGLVAHYPFDGNANDISGNHLDGLEYNGYASELPSLAYSSYIGGYGTDFPSTLKVSRDGYLYMAGSTSSADFPVTQGTIQTTYGGGTYDAWVGKFNGDGTPVWTTFLGGSGRDQLQQIALGPDNTIYLVGETQSADFPVQNATQPVYGGLGGNYTGEPYGDAFVTKLSNDGRKLIYSTYIGGSNGDRAFGIAVDEESAAIVTGHTQSLDFPTINPLDDSYNSPSQHRYGDAYVVKLDAEGSPLFSTYLGGSRSDLGLGIGLDGDGNIYVGGDTYSTDYPIRNAFQETFGGGERKGMITKLDASGQNILYSTYIGGSGNAMVFDIAVTESGEVAYTGQFADGAPLINALFSHAGGRYDSYIGKLDSAGEPIFGTYVGSSSEDRAFGITIDHHGNIHAVGETASADFPTVNPIQSNFGGGSGPYGDGFVVTLTPDGSELLFSTYLGGVNIDNATNGVAVDDEGAVWVPGITQSPDFPITADAYQQQLKGSYDGTYSKITGVVPAHPSPPVASCKNPQPVPADNSCRRDVSIDNGSYDPDGDEIALVQQPEGPYGLGVTEVTLLVTDVDGLSDSCSALVIVFDDTDPSITCPQPIVVEATGPQTPVVVNPVTSDNCTVTGTSCNPTSPYPLGTAVGICTATDQSDYSADADCVFSVNVVDTTPPRLTVPADMTVEATGQEGANVVYSRQSAVDLVYGLVTPICSPEAGSVFSLGSTDVTCEATDSANNASSASFAVNVVDTTPPTITLSVPADGAKFVLLENVSADWSTNDVVGIDIDSAVGTVASGELIDTATSGDKTFTVMAIDKAGNETVVTHAYEVLAPKDAVRELVKIVQDLNLDSDVELKLLKHIDDPESNIRGSINGFKGAVRSEKNKGRLSSEIETMLKAYADLILAAL